MHKIRILPRLAITGIRKNIGAYLPYIFATAFAVAVFFVFSAIAANPIIQSMPHSSYLLLLMQIGKVLLGLILIPFLFYTNSFLMKRRKRELGLYSILGLEKKHIGFVITTETVAVYAASLILGVVGALVFSKLIFLLLLNITGLPVDVQFTAQLPSYLETAAFFGCVFLANLVLNLVSVSRANPSDLFRSAQKGEKQPKRLWPKTVLGLLFLGGGYYLAITFELSEIFPVIFFAAIVLVVLGTYCLFSAGIVTFLRMLKKNKRYYYSKKNFVVVSGMLYRMRKSAASLANICIFSTMIMVTLVCTVSLFGGMESIADYQYPYDFHLRFEDGKVTGREQMQQTITAKAQENGAQVPDYIAYEYMSIDLERNGNAFTERTTDTPYENRYIVRVLRLEDYNRMEQADQTLAPGEVLLYNRQGAVGLKTFSIAGKTYRVKQEPDSMRIEPKETKAFDYSYYLVVSDRAEQQWLYDTLHRTEDQWIYSVRFNLNGEQENKAAFEQELGAWLEQQPGFSGVDSRLQHESESGSVYGGLLFLGIFFGIIFMVCMIMIMYYKQLSEGMEDQTNFIVMQQVGMSEPEVRAVIRRQILTVFLLPLAVAFLHMAMAAKPVEVMLSSMYLYNHRLIVLCTLAVSAVFALIYAGSYFFTAKAYYRIVRR